MFVCKERCFPDALPAIMGIINVTPDSFSDGGDALVCEAAVERGLRLVGEGADILDVGGESTRPGACRISFEQELKRVLPVIKELVARTSCPISIDTYKAKTAEQAVVAGACIVNDVSGLHFDPDIAHVAAEHGAGLVLNHWDETRNTDQPIVPDVLCFFERALESAFKAGVKREQIILDPGIGFAKNTNDNLVLIKTLQKIMGLGFPVLVGASRKRMIRALTGIEAPKERLAGTLGAHLMAWVYGASYVRVHDVKAHKDALSVAQAVASAKEVV